MEFDEIDVSDYELIDEYDEDTEFEKVDESECPRCTHGCNYCLMTGY